MPVGLLGIFIFYLRANIVYPSRSMQEICSFWDLMRIVNNPESEYSVGYGGGQNGKFGNVSKEALSDRYFESFNESENCLSLEPSQCLLELARADLDGEESVKHLSLKFWQMRVGIVKWVESGARDSANCIMTVDYSQDHSQIYQLLLPKLQRLSVLLCSQLARDKRTRGKWQICLPFCLWNG